MNLINSLSLKTSEALKRKYGDVVPSIDIMRYSIKFLITNITPIILIIVISLFTDNLFNALIALIGFVSLRMLTGGYHIDSAELCVVFSTLIIILISHLTILEKWYFLFQVTSLILVILFAPFNITNKTKIPIKHYSKLKYAAIILLLISTVVFPNIILSIAFLTQSLTLVHLRGGGKR